MKKLLLILNAMFLGVILSVPAMADKIVTVDTIRIGKIVYKLNVPSNAEILLTNRSISPQQIDAVCSVTFGIADKRIIGKQPVSLAPAEDRKIKVSWDSGKNDGGYEFRVELYLNGKLIDSRSEYAAVTNIITGAGQYSVANPGWFSKPGQEKVYIDELKRNYFSFAEYYTWTSCPMTGLTPAEDEWMPHTESQVSYEAVVNKKFVKSFVAEAHQNGIAVFPWMNGEVALPTGLDHPEYFRYGKNGQPLLYNGTVHNGKRYAIAYTSYLYNEENAYKWGREMAKSIDMFGWDGCRFDWAFLPATIGDPMRATKSDWFNFAGKSARELYPDQDTEGTKFLQSFRKGVAETHPEFIYGTNAGDEIAQKVSALEKYHKEASTNSWLWFEYLLNYEKYTWEEWITKITQDASLSRLNNCQVGIGWMSPPPASAAVTAKLLPYLFVYSGVHWIGPMDRDLPRGENWKIWRYAMRYSAYFYNNGFKLLSEDKRFNTISVAGGKRLFWKQWVFEKQTATGRELMINMVNLPEGKNILADHKAPAPQQNVVLTFNKNSNEKFKQAVVLNAEPEPNSAVLESSVENNTVTVKIPSVTWGASVLIETANQ